MDSKVHRLWQKGWTFSKAQWCCCERCKCSHLFQAMHSLIGVRSRRLFNVRLTKAAVANRLSINWLEFPKRILISPLTISKLNHTVSSLGYTLTVMNCDNSATNFNFLEIFIQASDTAGLSLSTAVLMMAIHTDCQQRMFDELITVMPNKDMDLTTDMLSKLPFMDACIRESLRLFPTVPLIGRSPAEPIVLNNTEIPPGVTVILGIRQIQRQQEYWGEDAHLYKPERFLGDNASYKEIPGCYIPFSSGPRNCIGKIQWNRNFHRQFMFTVFRWQDTATPCTQWS